MQQPKFSVTTLESSSNYAKFVIEPLENGFGNTLGNSLRRVLLSSLRGAAITKVKVEGVSHKFTTLAGMSEDMIDLMLNLKGIKVGYEGEEPVHATISAKGKVVTAKDIQAPATVHIINPDATIATLAKDAKLEIDLEISSGYGYSPAEDRPVETVGTISLDAIFSPVESVTYKVEATRVGRRTDYDKLVIEMHTDGSRENGEILKEAAQILMSHFSEIVTPSEVVEGGVATIVTESGLSVDELGLPTRIANALKNAGYKSVKELLAATNRDLKGVKNLGGKSLEEVDEALSARGLKRAV